MSVPDHFTIGARKYVPEQLPSLPPVDPRLMPLDRFVQWASAFKNGAIRRVRKWGDPIMVAQAGASVSLVGTSNFQAVGLWNKLTGWGGVTNFLRISHSDMTRVSQLQVEDEYQDKASAWLDQKMKWLYKDRGTIYFADGDNAMEWNTAPSIRWGTIALGGNLVKIAGYETLRVKLRNEETAQYHTMARLAGMRKTDWARPAADLLAEGLVHRCFCAYSGDGFGDSPKGIVYSPFFSPQDWDFAGTQQPDAFYIPESWLE